MRQLQLIQLYYYVCQCYDNHFCLHFQRQSNNHSPVFTAQELITIYLFGLLQRRFTHKESYGLIQDYWQSWFPALPSYQAYNYRITQLHWHLEVLVSDLLTRICYQECYQDICLVDSLPIILSKRPYQAKVALRAADKGYCSTARRPGKKLYYHGMKLHFLGADRPERIPLPERMQFTTASTNDLTALKDIVPQLSNRVIIGDKAFTSLPLNEQLLPQQVEIITPVKLQRGQKRLDAADTLFSNYVTGPPGGSIRQPVESFFNWLIESTNIQTASKVRSEKGLWLHCYGRIAAALFYLVFNS